VPSVPPELHPAAALALARSVLEAESRAVLALTSRLDDGFIAACRLLLACAGRVVVTGMGKSGHIGGKLAATLASTGTPAFFVHPGEASHGDLGMVQGEDVVIALSNSGETSELLGILPLLKRLGTRLIALTGRPGSTLARLADVHLDVSVAAEACPLGLAPTTSTTAALAMGDALALALLEARGFSAEDFARTHPGGALGRRLLTQVADLMHRDERLPVVAAATPIAAALVEMTRQGLGLTAVRFSAPAGGPVPIGVFTDGDLRRAVETGVDLACTPIGQLASRNPKTCQPQELAVEALNRMEAHSISALLVMDETGALVGALHMHDLLRAGVA